MTSHPLLSRGAERISGSQSADENVNHFTPARRRARYGRAGDSKSNQKFPKREFFIFQAWGINLAELESMGVGLSDEENRKQFAGIVVPHLSEAFAVASWLTGNRTDAEDVVQEACLRAFRAIGSFAGVNARAWVLTIVRHTAYSWLAKNRPSEIVAVEDFLGEERLTEQCIGGWSATVTSTPETALLAKLDVRRLEAAIAALPLAFREVLILRDLQGLEYREIAEVTTLPVGTVMSRLARARRRIIDAVRTNDA